MIFIRSIVKKVLTDILMKYLKTKEDDLVAKLEKELNHNITLDFRIIAPEEDYWLTVKITMIIIINEEFVPYSVGRVSINEEGLIIYGYTEQLKKIINEVYT